MIEGRRLGIRFKSGLLAYYDIDPDGKVYWLRVRNNDKVQRIKVKEERFAGWIREQAGKMPKEPADGP